MPKNKTASLLRTALTAAATAAVATTARLATITTGVGVGISIAGGLSPGSEATTAHVAATLGLEETDN